MGYKITGAGIIKDRREFPPLFMDSLSDYCEELNLLENDRLAWQARAERAEAELKALKEQVAAEPKPRFKIGDHAFIKGTLYHLGPVERMEGTEHGIGYRFSACSCHHLDNELLTLAEVETKLAEMKAEKEKAK